MYFRISSFIKNMMIMVPSIVIFFILVGLGLSNNMALYYIHDNIFSANPNSLSKGVRIIKWKNHVHPIFKYGEGPYNSIKELKKRSLIFKSLASNNPKRAAKILIEENILENCILAGNETKNGINIDFARKFKHITKGEVKKQYYTGGHYYDQNNMRLILRSNEDYYGVFYAVVEVFDKDTNQKHLKYSTFFPIKWSLSDLLEECQFALSNNSNVTKSGIKVKIVKIDGEIKTIYPIFCQTLGILDWY